MTTTEQITIPELERHLQKSPDIIRYITAGKATFTIRSVDTKVRYTYKIVRMKRDAYARKEKLPEKWFVMLLVGPDNESSFIYMGLLQRMNGRLNKVEDHNKYSFSTTRNSFAALGIQELANTRPAVAAFDFLIKWLNVKPTMTPKIEFWHSGRCGRCGKKLTVPESIEMGLGPECASKGF